MSDQIQGRDVTVKMYQAGKLIGGVPVKSVNDEAEAEIRSRDLLGQRRSKKQLIINGYKGTIGGDVDSGRLLEIDKYLNDSDKSGSPTYDFAIQIRYNYRDGSSKSVRFTKVTFMPPKSGAKGRKDDVDWTLDWEAEDKIFL